MLYSVVLVIIIILVISCLISFTFMILGYFQAKAYKISRKRFDFWVNKVKEINLKSYPAQIETSFQLPKSEHCYYKSPDSSMSLNVGFVEKNPLFTAPSIENSFNLWLDKGYLSLFRDTKIEKLYVGVLYITNFRLIFTCKNSQNIIIHLADIEFIKPSLIKIKNAYRFAIIINLFQNRKSVLIIVEDYNAYLVTLQVWFMWQEINVNNLISE